MKRPWQGYCLQSQVDAFHEEMGLVDPKRPINPDDELRMERARLVVEESMEQAVALVGGDHAFRLAGDMLTRILAKRGHHGPGDLAEIADGAIDTCVVSYGTLSRMGVFADPLEDAVMRANMAKVGGGRDEHGKFQKPEGWTPPDIETELRKQGWAKP